MTHANMGCGLTTTEIRWAINALNHEVAALQAEQEANKDNGLAAVSEVMIAGRQNLARKLSDIVNAGFKMITIKP